VWAPFGRGFPNAFITDLKKKKLQLKEYIALGKPLPKGAHTKLASMLHSHKVNEKMKRKQRKIAKHAYDEELKRRLSKLSNWYGKGVLLGNRNHHLYVDCYYTLDD
jgi:hypothetical protein